MHFVGVGVFLCAESRFSGMMCCFGDDICVENTPENSSFLYCREYLSIPQNIRSEYLYSQKLDKRYFFDRINIGIANHSMPYGFIMSVEEYNLLLAAEMPRLLLYAHRFWTSDDDAEDLLQDTLLQLLEHRTRYVEGNFLGWGYAHMKHLYLNSLRRPALAPFSAEMTSSDSEYIPSDDMRFDISMAMEGLSDVHRSTIGMYLNGYEYHEIAHSLHLSMGTVKSRISRAKTELKRRLGNYR